VRSAKTEEERTKQNKALRIQLAQSEAAKRKED